MPTTITPQDFMTRYPDAGCSEGDVQDYICIVDSKDACLDSHYEACVIRQIKLTFVAIMCSASTGGQRNIKSQRAPNGASRSFEYIQDNDLTLERKIKALDTANCVTPLLPGKKFSVRASGGVSCDSTIPETRSFRIGL